MLYNNNIINFSLQTINCAYAYIKSLKIYSTIPLKKTAFCLKTSHFINKYDPPQVATLPMAPFSPQLQSKLQHVSAICVLR